MAKSMRTYKGTPGIVSLDVLADLFGLPSTDDLYEGSAGYLAEVYSSIYKAALEEQSKHKAEERAAEVEQEEMSAIYSRHVSAILSAVEPIFEHHHLELIHRNDEWKDEYFIQPESSSTWRDAANAIRQTINGVGYFHFNTLKEFLDSGPWTAKEAVLSHLGSISDAVEVYGLRRPKSSYYSAMSY